MSRRRTWTLSADMTPSRLFAAVADVLPAAGTLQLVVRGEGARASVSVVAEYPPEWMRDIERGYRVAYNATIG